jgi:rhodanese-related sulfurtransferase
MPLTVISPEETLRKIQQGALLVDIREVDEVQREWVKDAVNYPLSTLHDPINITNNEVIFTCRSGMRTQQNETLLASKINKPGYILEGGINGWVKAGNKTFKNLKQPLEINRQVQITAGSFGLIGAILALTLSPNFAYIPAFIGAGLVFSGVTGTCGMAKMLKIMPWNK